MNSNIFIHKFRITKSHREAKHGHKAFVVWFTGLSGSGKSTLANLIEIELQKRNISTYILDGDNVRNGINNDLTFIPKDRSENIRRIAEICNLMTDAGLVTLASFISPYAKDRELARTIVGVDNFIEIFVNTSLKVCERRDVKGIYKKARSGAINNFTGISSPYESPINPDFEIITDNKSIEDCVKEIMIFLKDKLK